MKTRDALILPTLAALLAASGCSSTADYSPPPPGSDAGRRSGGRGEAAVAEPRRPAGPRR